MTDPAIIEAAARAMCDGRKFLKGWDDTSDSDREWYGDLARSALAAVTPMIEAAALERAAKVAEALHDEFKGDNDYYAGHRLGALACSDAIRALMGR